MADNRVDLWAFLRANQKSLDETKKRIEDQLREAGRDGSAAMAQEVEKASPRVRKALNGVTEATVANNRAERESNALKEEGVKLTERRAKLEIDMEAQQRKNFALRNAELTVGRQLVEVQQERERLGERIAQQEERVAQARTKANALNEYVKGQNLANRNTRATRDVLRMSGDPEDRAKAAALTRELAEAEEGLNAPRKAQFEANKALKADEAELVRLRGDLVERNTQVKDSETELTQVRKEAAAGSKNLQSLESDLNKVKEEGSKLDERQVRSSEAVAASYRRRSEALKNLSETHENEIRKEEERARKEDERNRRRRSGGRGGRSGGGAADTLGSVFTDLPFVPGGAAGAAIGSIALTDMVSVAEGATTAAQAIALLPAVAVAGGAALGTLAIGMTGFDKAIKNMGDPKKFAKDLQGLAPAAQQAALEIQALVKGPLGNLKRIVQGTLFNGVSNQLQGLANSFTPVLTQLTAGIAGAFNGFFTTFSQTLQGGAERSSIGQIVNDIVKSFQNLGPAVAPFTDAFLKITQVGASFLPGLASSIADMATTFSNFIQNAATNGGLHDFIQRGIDGAKVLGQEIWKLGQDLFGLLGNKSPDDLRQSLDGVREDIMTLADAISGVAHFIKDWKTQIEIAAAAFAVFKIGGAIASGIKGIGLLLGVGGAETVGGALAAIPGLAGGASAGLAGMASAAAAPLAAIAATVAALGISIAHFRDEMNKPWNKGDGAMGNMDPGSAPGVPAIPKVQGPGVTPALPNLPALPGATPQGTGNGNPLGNLSPGGKPQSTADYYKNLYPAPPPLAGIGDQAPTFDVPAPPPPTGVTDSSERKRILSTLDPNAFMPDITQMLPDGVGAPPGLSTPGASNGVGPVGPGGTGYKTPGALQYGTNGMPYQKPGFGYDVTDQKQIFDKQYELQKAALSLRDARMEEAATEQDNLHTQEDLLKAKEKVADAEHGFTDAQLNLAEANQGKWKKAGAGMNAVFGEIGANLDKDLGFSKGLPGLADNLIKFVASLAAAPIMGQLAPYAAQGDPKSYGALGMMFGGGSGKGLGPASYQNQLVGGGGGYASDAALLGNVPAGKYGRGFGSDLTKGLGDCSSAVEDLVNLMDGKSTAGASMTTLNEGQILAQHGFLPTDKPMPGTFQVGWNDAHTQATLPGGTNFNWGSDAAALKGGVDGAGAWDPTGGGTGAFTQHYYRPVGAPVSGLPPAPTVASTAAPSIPATSPASSAYLNSPANTNPGLNDPLPPPGSLPGGGGGGPGMGMPQGLGLGGPPLSPAAAGAPLGAGNSVGLAAGAPYQAQGLPQASGQQWQPNGGGGIGVGGGLMGMAIQGGASMFGGPAGAAAAQTGMQLLNSGIKFAGQAGGILAEGALDTFLPTDPDTGKSPIKDSWLWRAAGALAGATPAIGGGGAGGMDKLADQKLSQPNGQQDPNQQQQSQSGPLVHIENLVQGDGQSGKSLGQDVAHQLQNATNEAPMPRP